MIIGNTTDHGAVLSMVLQYFIDLVIHTRYMDWRYLRTTNPVHLVTKLSPRIAQYNLLSPFNVEIEFKITIIVLKPWHNVKEN